MTRSGPLAVRVRRADHTDSALLAEVGAETFRDAFGAANTPEDMDQYLQASFGPEIQAAELADPSSLFLIAEMEGETVGYARLRWGKAPEAIGGARPVEIVRFYARTRWIGRKVGAALMTACLEEARAMRCDTIWLDVWEENGRAIDFYERWGFGVVGTQPFQLGGDIQKDLLMQRLVEITP